MIAPNNKHHGYIYFPRCGTSYVLFIYASRIGISIMMTGWRRAASLALDFVGINSLALCRRFVSISMLLIKPRSFSLRCISSTSEIPLCYKTLFSVPSHILSYHETSRDAIFSHVVNGVKSAVHHAIDCPQCWSVSKADADARREAAANNHQLLPGAIRRSHAAL